TQTTSFVRLEGEPTDGAATLIVSNGFTNNGILQLADTSVATGALLFVVSGTLTNAAGASLAVPSASTGAHTIAATINNQGAISASGPLTIQSDGAQHVNSGTIDVAAGGVVSIVQTGASPSFTNTGSLSIASGSLLALSGGTFNQNGGAVSGQGSLIVANATINLSATFASATATTVLNAT